jgi:hypothetical protein
MADFDRILTPMNAGINSAAIQVASPNMLRVRSAAKKPYKMAK